MVDAFAGERTSPSGVLETRETTQRIPCQPEAGTLGDGRITTQFDWSGLYVPGTACPDPSTLGGEASRTMVHVVLSSGRSIIVSSYRDSKDQLDALYASGRLRLPFEGVLLFGY